MYFTHATTVPALSPIPLTLFLAPRLALDIDIASTQQPIESPIRLTSDL